MKFLRPFQNFGQAAGLIYTSPAFIEVQGLALDAADNLYCSDGISNFIFVFLRGSTTVARTIGGTSSTGPTASTLNGPAGIAFDSAWNLYVADFFNHRVLRFGSSVVFTGSSGFVAGDVTIPPTATISIATALSIGGSLTSFAALALGTNATLIVNGSANIFAPVRVSSGALIDTVGNFTVGGGVTLTPIITQSPGWNVSSISFLVARFAASTGSTFVLENAVANFSGSECYALGPPVQTVSSTTLSISISVAYTCDGLSVGAMIGIAVGASVLGVGLVIVLISIIRYNLQRRESDMKVELKQKLLDNNI